MKSVNIQLNVNAKTGVTLMHQLVQQITWLVASGQLKPGDRLPTVRDLANQLSINLHTVRKAYLKLEELGLVETRPGKGTHVLQYDLRRIVQSSISNRSHTIGVILPSFTNPFYHAFLQGVEQVADEDQTLLFVCNTEDDGAEALRYFAQLTAKEVDGILVVSHGVVNELLEGTESLTQLVPTVTIDWPRSKGYLIEFDLENAGYLATHHLIEHGHQHIGLITFFREDENVRPVNAGYRRALNEVGLEYETELVQRMAGFKLESGIEGMRRLLALPRRPTAVFTIADTLALGVLNATKEAGLRIPEDIALASFNDIPLASMVQPALTSVTSHPEQAGIQAMDMLQKLISGKRPAKRHLLLPTDLVIRQSCGCN
jgi:DNA-binding LacI/PurR family transcriptional regulator